MVACLAAFGLIVNHSEVVHPQAGQHREGDHQGSVAHVTDVHGEREIGNAAVGELVPSNVVGLTVGYEKADFHVVGG